MIRQTIVWTLLPDPAAPQAADGAIRLSLLASPRLTSDAVVPLSRYPALADWPGVRLQAAVEITGPAGTVTLPAEFVDDPPDAALWRAVFPPDLPVVPFVFDRAPAETPILSYPAERLRASLAHEYGRLFGPAEAEPPTQDSPSGELFARSEPGWEAADRLVRIVGYGGPARSAVSGVRGRLDAVPDDRAEDPAGWSRLADFHRPRRSTDQARALGLTNRDEPVERDFHARFAALADHPNLQARLGLVRGLRVRLPANLTGPLTIRAVLSHAAGLSDYRPRTRCVARAGQLRLAAADGKEAPPYLPLDDISRYAAIDVDIDAAGLALQSYASSLALAPRDRPAPRLQPPALRSDGIFVAEADRQIRFKSALRRAADVLDADLAAGGDGGAITLDADDVQLGYRVDVLDVDSGRWYPLCRRVGTYRVAGITAPLPIDDEGTVCDVLAASDDGGSPANLLHQSLFRWNGWSLVAPPPGLMLDLNGQPADPVPEPDGDLPFTMTVTPAPGTLPSLRYGRGYRFRARVVDIAGRSVPFSQDPAVPTPATPALRHRRYEPVPSPVLVPRRPVTEGESAAVLVVRTDNRDLEDPRPGPACERHVLAPKAAVLTLERHGVLDVPGENRLDPDAYALLFERDRGVVAGTPDAGASGAPFVDADTVALPWLPDPLAHGVTIHGLTGSSDLHLDWPQGGAWHERLPIRLIVEAGGDVSPTSALADPAGRTIRVVLAPGAALSATLSSRLSEGDEEIFGTWRWFADAHGRAAIDVAARRGDTLAGRISQVTPPYEVRMVHAVRRPHKAPLFSAPQIRRFPDDTAYELADPAISIHPASTASVHVEAEWSTVVDDPAQPEPVRVTGRSILEQGDQDRLAAWGDPPASPTVPFRASVGLGDTRHHIVRFTPVATSRFAAYFTERRTVRLTGTEAVRLGDALVPGTVVVTDQSPPAPTTYRLDRDVVVDHSAGTVARRADGAVPDGADVDIAFVTPPVTRAGPAVTHSVPASARPAPPTIHSIVPAYAWRHQRAGNTIMSTRRGGLLRVYLERPWFDSGDGELLAVIVADDDLRHLSQTTWAQTLPLVSGAGADPTGLGGGAPDLARSSFPRAATSQIVRVPGLHNINPSQATNPLFRVKAVGHPVQFDPRARLWFSDVEVRHETDQPFVRLKLARLQPDAVRLPTPGALEDLHLSQIVDAGFHQLPTDRTAAVVIDGTTARVTVTGPALTDIVSEVTATVRVASPDGGDPVVWEGLRQLPRTPLTAGPFVDASATRQWTGLVNLPAPPGAQPMQLLLREHQLLPGGPQSTGQARRLSYFDVLDL